MKWVQLHCSEQDHAVASDRRAIANISAKSIYADSLVTLWITSSQEFSALISGVVVRLIKGIGEPNQLIRSIEERGLFFIEAEVWGWFEERVVEEKVEKEDEISYGMRFYPLISSNLQGSLEVQPGRLGLVSVELPDDFRLIWHDARVMDSAGNQANLVHAYGRDQSKYIFRWRGFDNPIASCRLQVPIRLSGSALERILHFPIYYWMLSLFAVALASTAQSVGILLAAVAGVWTFMLQQWSSASLPQRSTILTHGYLLAGVLTAIWAAYWRLFGLMALILSVPIGLGLFIVFRWLSFFERHGVLPPRPARYWARIVRSRLLRERRGFPPKA